MVRLGSETVSNARRLKVQLAATAMQAWQPFPFTNGHARPFGYDYDGNGRGRWPQSEVSGFVLRFGLACVRTGLVSGVITFTFCHLAPKVRQKPP